MEYTHSADNIREHFDAAFEVLISQLNDEQRAAVDILEGPVLVVAGPGTGKTHILSARIGNILRSTDTEPHNILCLTYTDAGVHAMRERLVQFIGPAGHRVHIHTFHSFCNGIIQDNLSLFGIRQLEPISELEQLTIVQELLDPLPAQHPLKPTKGDGYYYEQHILGLFRLMKTEGWTATSVQADIDTYLNGLLHDETFRYKRNHGKNKKGDLNERAIHEKQQSMQKLSAGALLFDEFVAKMTQRKRYDFNDMLLWVSDIFQRHTYLLRRYQEQYLYILVDEFQDTSGIQNKLLEQLLSFWGDNPNIFVVGDDDQAIYEFQGARIRNIQEFVNRYQQHLQVVVLQQNYRSTQPILNLAHAVIAHNTLRLTHVLSNTFPIQKNLVATRPNPSPPILPTITTYPTQLHEEIHIVQQITTLLKQGTPPPEIAVIYSKHKQSTNLIALLEREAIPYNAKKRINVLHDPLLIELLKLLQYLQKEAEKPYSAEDLLFEVLHNPCFHIHPLDIAILANHLYEQNKTQKDRKTHLKWRNLIADPQALQTLPLKNTKNILAFADLSAELILCYRQLTLTELLERTLNRSGLLAYLMQHPQNRTSIPLIYTFYYFVQNEVAKNPTANVADLLATIAKMNENKLQLNLQKTLNAANEGIKLLTAHSAKGLEFTHVFILDCVKERWEADNTSANYQFKLPPTLTHNSTSAEDDQEAARRLFYVALTRAKTHLHLSYAQTDNDQKPLQKTTFLDEALTAQQNYQLRTITLPDTDLLQAQARTLAPPTIPPHELLSTPLLNEILANFTLSATSLHRYTTCPISFYYHDVLRIPTTTSEAAAYGIAIHHALRLLFERMKSDPELRFPSQKTLIQDFEAEMERQRKNFTLSQYRRRLQQGREILPQYFLQQLGACRKNVNLETHIHTVEYNGVPLTGTIDKIEFLDSTTLHIVDYKTGKPHKEHLKPPSNPIENPIGGKYWQQLHFYKILLQRHPQYQQYNITDGRIEYLEKDRKTDTFPAHNIELHYNHTDLVKKQITHTYQQIQAHQFYVGCGKPTCKWCQFVSQRTAPNSFRDDDGETLDD
jgi:DNA helicase-2/ATP-dependent DNA helicase PcrA